MFMKSVYCAGVHSCNGLSVKTLARQRDTRATMHMWRVSLVISVRCMHVYVDGVWYEVICCVCGVMCAHFLYIE